jgi:hypothetical protein
MRAHARGVNCVPVIEAARSRLSSRIWTPDCESCWSTAPLALHLAHGAATPMIS